MSPATYQSNEPYTSPVGIPLDNQAAAGWSLDTSGGNSLGATMPDGQLRQPPDFMGDSGKPDNRSTNRPKGTV